HRAGTFFDRLLGEVGKGRCAIEETAGLFVSLQQSVEALAQQGVAGASLVQKGGSFGRVFSLQRFDEDRLFLHAARSLPPGLRSCSPMRRLATNAARNLKELERAGGLMPAVRVSPPGGHQAPRSPDTLPSLSSFRRRRRRVLRATRHGRRPRP